MKMNRAWAVFAVAVAGVLRSGEAIGFPTFWDTGLRDPPAARSARTPTLKWITQPVDHFNTRDNRTWSMKYYENDQFLSSSKPNPPIFMMLGGEGMSVGSWLQGGHMYELASTHGAMMYETEHRYYGQSRPTSDAGSENLQYLNVDQALADVAYLIKSTRKERNFENSTLIVFGGSYPGSMAAWARLKYPHLIQGALASSAPVLAKADFHEMYDVVTEAIASYDPQCVENINEAFLTIEKLLQTTSGPQTLKKYLNLCDEIDTSSWRDVSSSVKSLTQYFVSVVQNNQITASGKTSIGDMCDVMTAEHLGSPLQRLSTLVIGPSCLDVSHKSFVTLYSESDWNSYAALFGMRPWAYQTCTEFGYFPTLASNNSIFGHFVGIEYFTEFCKEIYGEYFDASVLDKGVERTNIIYGGWNPDLTNVIFTNGDIDPWHVLSVLEDVNESSPAIVIKGASHCQDLYSASPTDSTEMTAARAKIRQIIGEWLS